MPDGLLVRLRPTGPWRIGPDSGDRDRVDRIYHSDSLYAAVSNAMARLGQLEEWLDATAHKALEPDVRFSSCFPFLRDTLFVVPPRSVWPPAPSAKVRWKGAQFVPVSLVESLLADHAPEEDQWTIDAASGCLVPADRAPGAVAGPFRVAVRSNAAVDRLVSGAIFPHSTACLEFPPDAGLWALVAFSGDEASARWSEPVRAAFRLLADSGFGGERSRGWGRAESPEFKEDALPELLLKLPAPEAETAHEHGYWLLSLFSPSDGDVIDWQRGTYTLSTRGGRVESNARWGELKKQTRMVTEGSVLLAGAPPRGTARNVAPDEFPHPVYRAGFALTIAIPWRTGA